MIKYMYISIRSLRRHVSYNVIILLTRVPSQNAFDVRHVYMSYLRRTSLSFVRSRSPISIIYKYVNEFDMTSSAHRRVYIALLLLY